MYLWHNVKKNRKNKKVNELVKKCKLAEMLQNKTLINNGIGI